MIFTILAPPRALMQCDELPPSVSFAKYDDVVFMGNGEPKSGVLSERQDNQLNTLEDVITYYSKFNYYMWLLYVCHVPQSNIVAF